MRDSAGAPDDLATLSSPPVAASWSIDLLRPAAVDGQAVSDWRALMIRSGIRDPLRDPDHLLPLAQHGTAGRRIAFAFVWSAVNPDRRDLRGVLPLAMPHPLWGRGLARRWQPSGIADLTLSDSDAAAAVDATIRDHLSGLNQPLSLHGEEPLASPRQTIEKVEPSSALPIRAIPPDSMLGVRPQSFRSSAAIESVREPGQIRDAVERFLTLDAHHSSRPIIADPSEASLVRVVTRLFARRRETTVEFARQAGEIVSGTLYLGSGPARVAWRHAACA